MLPGDVDDKQMSDCWLPATATETAAAAAEVARRGEEESLASPSHPQDNG